jgi:hypothetical protein
MFLSLNFLAQDFFVQRCILKEKFGRMVPDKVLNRVSAGNNEISREIHHIYRWTKIFSVDKK